MWSGQGAQLRDGLAAAFDHDYAAFFGLAHKLRSADVEFTDRRLPHVLHCSINRSSLPLGRLSTEPVPPPRADRKGEAGLQESLLYLSGWISVTGPNFFSRSAIFAASPTATICEFSSGTYFFATRITSSAFTASTFCA